MAVSALEAANDATEQLRQAGVPAVLVLHEGKPASVGATSGRLVMRVDPEGWCFRWYPPEGQ